MDPDEFEIDEDGVPWASPEIQKRYEAALGRFMVAFNRLDNLLTEVIRAILDQARVAEMINQIAMTNFGQKLATAKLLKSSVHGAGLSDVPFGLMREIATCRNHVAHGHFDQNPHSGEYDIVARKSRRYSDVDLGDYTAKANKAYAALASAEAFYQFSNAPLPPG